MKTEKETILEIANVLVTYSDNMSVIEKVVNENVRRFISAIEEGRLIVCYNRTKVRMFEVCKNVGDSNTKHLNLDFSFLLKCLGFKTKDQILFNNTNVGYCDIVHKMLQKLKQSGFISEEQYTSLDNIVINYVSII